MSLLAMVAIIVTWAKLFGDTPFVRRMCIWLMSWLLGLAADKTEAQGKPNK